MRADKETEGKSKAPGAKPAPGAPAPAQKRKFRLTLHAERQVALNRLFASNPPQRSAGPRDIQRSAPQTLSLSVAPPACEFAEDHTLHLRDSVPPSNHRYIETECPREPV